MARRGAAWPGVVWYGEVRLGSEVWWGAVGSGVAWLGWVWWGEAGICIGQRYGWAWWGLVRLGMARRGEAR